MSLFNAAKDIVNIIANGEQPIQLPDHVPGLPKIDKRLKLEFWRNDVDESFTISKPITVNAFNELPKPAIDKTTNDNVRQKRSAVEHSEEALNTVLNT